MVASTSVALGQKSQEAFLAYYRNVQALMNITRSQTRSKLELIDRTYMREMDKTADKQTNKAINRAGDPDRLQNITVPVVMPQIEAAVVHQTSVFLTGLPIFGVVADPAFMDEALQLETKLENDSIRGGWTRELMMFFRNGFKYNYAPVEISWDRDITYSVETNLNENVKEGVPVETLWTGNTLRTLDPYNTFVDERVSPTEVYKKGEFGGFTEMMTRIELKSFIARLPDHIVANVVPAFESGRGSAGTAGSSTSFDYYVPLINPEKDSDRRVKGVTDWLLWAGLPSPTSGRRINYKDSYDVTTLYCKILPDEFDLKVPKSKTAQIYKVILVNHQHIIYCERQTNAHSYIPILIGQPLEDGLGYQTKSLAENGMDFQEAATAMFTSVFASARRRISDRLLYDPSRIDKAAINSPNPSAKIPVRQSAFGSKLSDAVYAFPYNEDQSRNDIEQMQQIIAMSNQLNGQNQVDQGQFIKGNKTVREFDSVLKNSGGRDQMASILLQDQVFVPMGVIIKTNILQFQGGITLYNRNKKRSIKIDPVALRKAVLEFKLTDGLNPAEKVINAEGFTTFLQMMGSAPQIASEYNIGPLVSYLMKTQGADVTDFEKTPEQIAYEQALQAWQVAVGPVLEAALKSGTKLDPKDLPPQPLPEQFGFNPQQREPQPPEASTSDIPKE